MTILITGVAGFIGYHVAKRVLERDVAVIGIDNLNAYYDVSLKQARLSLLQRHPAFAFHRIDIADRTAVFSLSSAAAEVSHVVHLAAQPGVRHSLLDPYVYIEANVMGHVVISEYARRCPKLTHFVYASSSSVYGASETLPFSITDGVDRPNSLYAATKRSNELIAYSYAHLYAMPSTGLRLFTVYGPWGRPDMAPFIFTKAIFAGEPLAVANDGEIWRDFTYVDDIVDGILRALDRPPTGLSPPYRLYNLGSNRSEKLTAFISVLERAIGRPAHLTFVPMPPGDVPKTCADIEESRRDLGFEPHISIDDGLPRFVAWYRQYYHPATT